MDRSARLTRWFLAAILAMLFAPAHAVDGRLRIEQLYHTAWRAQEGAPSNILALAQTTDGFLWIGTAGGLIRFDGNRFDAVTPQGHALPSPAVTALLDTPDGSLWIAFASNVVARLKDGRYAWFDTGRADGGQPSSLFVDADGGVWNGAASGLFKLDGSRWRRFGPAEGFSNALAREHLLGPDGTLWVHADDGWYVLPLGSARFTRAAAALDTASAIDADGVVWTLGKDGNLRSAAPGRAGASGDARCAIPGGPDGQMRFDPGGVLWLASWGHGLVRVSRLPEAGTPRCDFDQYQEKDGLSGDAVESMIEDREGNVWLGTSNGLDRFRDARFVTAPFGVKHEGAALAAMDDGGVLTASFAHGAAIVHADGRAESVGAAEYLRMACAYRDPTGVLWVGGAKRLWRLRGKQFDQVAPPAAIAARSGPSDAIAVLMDGSGSLWVDFRPGGLYRFDGTTWTAVSPALGGTQRHAVMVDGGERGLLLSEGTGVRVILDGQARMLGAVDGLSVGSVTSIFVHGPDVWIGGTTGLALWRRGQMHVLHTAGNIPLEGVTGIAETTAGELWLNQRSGALHVSADELRRVLADPSHAIAVETFDRLDGLFGSGPSLFPTPSLIEGHDGRLWFSTYSGVFWLDPGVHLRAPEAPVAYITALELKGRTLAPSDRLALDAGTRQVRFGFTAASLGMPERVRFRYRLSGVDDDWRISQVRNTTYTNLGPGDYTFAVTAANASGVWSAVPASINFTIAPMFWQTAWFRALGIAAFIAVISGLYRWRLELHARRTQERIEVRLAERERIAQELHDTLLQGVQALSWKFQNLVAKLPGGTRLRTEMEDALGLAERLVDEGRDSVHGLRAPRSRSELAAAITASAAQLAVDALPSLSCAVENLPRALREKAWQELFRIGCEACSNALRHAHATTIRVTVHYGDDGLTLRISDDGVGFVPPSTAAHAAGRRWGLVGMHERAMRLGGALQVESRLGHGTSVSLRIEPSVAYVPL